MNRTGVYKCIICGNIVGVLHAGGGRLVCCGESMNLQNAKTEDQGMEKHVPVVEKTDKGVKVTVGAVQHPMEENHYIEWIEVITASGVQRKFLQPGDAPQASFKTTEEIIQIREYCSLHGLWTA